MEAMSRWQADPYRRKIRQAPAIPTDVADCDQVAAVRISLIRSPIRCPAHDRPMAAAEARA